MIGLKINKEFFLEMSIGRYLGSNLLEFLERDSNLAILNFLKVQGRMIFNLNFRFVVRKRCPKDQGRKLQEKRLVSLKDQYDHRKISFISRSNKQIMKLTYHSRSKLLIFKYKQEDLLKSFLPFKKWSFLTANQKGNFYQCSQRQVSYFKIYWKGLENSKKRRKAKSKFFKQNMKTCSINGSQEYDDVLDLLTQQQKALGQGKFYFEFDI